VTAPLPDRGGLRVERADGIGWLVIDRPERRNAIDRATRLALMASAADLDADPEVRVLVLTGGADTFCVGTDLKEAAPDPAPHPLVDPLPRISAALDAVGKPVIAAINGACLGGGLELALAADLRLASDNATFGLPEVRIGSLPGSGGTQRLFGAVPAASAWKMLLTGDSIDAPEALRIGLVSDVVPAAELRPTVAALAARIAANAPLSVRAIKVAGRAAQAGGAGEMGMTLERLLWALLATTEDRAEGRAAFRERRPPNYRGR
jgi:E-phenylitaconyl-CoA hydratase